MGHAHIISRQPTKRVVHGGDYLETRITRSNGKPVSIGVDLGNAFMAAMRDELFRRQYREERALPEHERPEIGGES
jgi:hypothetical protein